MRVERATSWMMVAKLKRALPALGVELSGGERRVRRVLRPRVQVTTSNERRGGAMAAGRETVWTGVALPVLVEG